MRTSLLAILLAAAAFAAAATGTRAQQQPPASPAAPSPPAATAPALPPEQLWMQRTCFTCHGKDAKTPILPEYPKLAGQSAPYLLRQMQDIKSGARNNANTPAMRGVMHLVTDEELRAIADWLATLKP
jgi:cytochrome c